MSTAALVSRSMESFELLRFTLTSDSSGDASATYSWSTSGSVVNAGWIRQVTVNPDGSAVPTHRYDVTVADASSVDILADRLLDLDDTDTEQARVDKPFVGNLTVTGANMGSAKTTVVDLYIEYPNVKR